MTTTPPDLDALRALSERWQTEPRSTVNLDVPARDLARAVPALLAHIDAQAAEIAALRNTARYIVLALDFPTPILLPADIMQYLNAALGGDIHPNVNRFMSMSAQDHESNDDDER